MLRKSGYCTCFRGRDLRIVVSENRGVVLFVFRVMRLFDVGKCRLTYTLGVKIAAVAQW